MERANGWQDSGATYAYPEPITKSDGESSGFTCDTLTPGEISVGGSMRWIQRERGGNLAAKCLKV